MPSKFCQKLWKNWLENVLNWSIFDFTSIAGAYDEQNQKWHESNQEWVFQDPNLFYYPLFGLGTEKSEVSFIAAGPGHNIDDSMNELTEGANYRENIEGPERREYNKQFKTQKSCWESERENSLIYRNILDVQKYIDSELLINNEGTIFENFYYTNFMKDGEFKGNDRIKLRRNIPSDLVSDRWNLEPNSDDEKLEIASREFWFPILGAELKMTEAEVIIPLGKKATEAVFNLHGIKYGENPLNNSLKQIESPGSSQIIIPSYHLSMINSNYIHSDISNLDECIQEKFQGIDSPETYIKILGLQISRALN